MNERIDEHLWKSNLNKNKEILRQTWIAALTPSSAIIKSPLLAKAGITEDGVEAASLLFRKR